MSSFRGEADEGDEETKKFRTGRGRKRRGEEVPAAVELGGGVVDVEEEEVDVLVCSAELHGVPASAAFSEASPNPPDFQRRKREIEAEGSGLDLGFGRGRGAGFLRRGKPPWGPRVEVVELARSSAAFAAAAALSLLSAWGYRRRTSRGGRGAERAGVPGCVGCSPWVVGGIQACLRTVLFLFLFFSFFL